MSDDTTRIVASPVVVGRLWNEATAGEIASGLIANFCERTPGAGSEAFGNVNSPGALVVAKYPETIDWIAASAAAIRFGFCAIMPAPI
ncbi:hypothetical protein [Microbacterium nanhaiense]|uniref:hypothetical protein n=1 Tax=Microbacterium nanhaiense TaxID=1301026 RepID=UPI00166D7E65|nr:hypothetical protein [Microbacterium nanhaiense]